jgi:hypothetical protein
MNRMDRTNKIRMPVLSRVAKASLPLKGLAHTSSNTPGIARRRQSGTTVRKSPCQWQAIAKLSTLIRPHTTGEVRTCQENQRVISWLVSYKPIARICGEKYAQILTTYPEFQVDRWYPLVVQDEEKKRVEGTAFEECEWIL